ncbi:MAG TPA: hypothetical protein VIA19_05380 [Burkholderiales bacterium]|jgi:hypothetical protein
MERFAARALCALMLAAAPAPLNAQEGRIEPVDEASRDMSWALFRAKLLTAVEKRDRNFVLGVLDRYVRNGSDAPRGIAEFRRQWEIDSDDGVFWRILPSALSVGSAWFERPNKQRELCAPYVLAKWPRDVDPGVYGVITAKEALVKDEPSWESGTIAKLSYHIVRVTDWEVADLDPKFVQKWVRIRLLKEGTGYVPEEHIRSPIEHTACFVRHGTGWRLTVFGPAARD